jgi:hypothetical protein
MFTQVLGLLLQASVPSASHDLGFLTAEALADRCKANSPADTSYCYAFITGVHDTMRAYEVWLNLQEFCPPPGLLQGDLRRTVLAYLTAYPGMGKGQAASTVVVALKTAFPCPAAPSPPPPGSQAPRN